MVKKLALLTLMLLTGTGLLFAQDMIPADSIPTDSLPSVTQPLKVAKDWSTWKPNPKRALWLALVIPGGGQIYNRKYWKLPLVYGGFVGCLYAMNWNNSQYKDYSQAFLDLSDNDPNTASYNKFLHLGVQITPDNEERYKDIFKKRRDKYRRWRDLSFLSYAVYMPYRSLMPMWMPNCRYLTFPRT